ncbi:aspartate/glutamate racemase family protein [Variovorax terrae]|uniref:Amino acid racemase n=1 Tax=Variovorax terrae TaxID=2923278 RepID=A0A9X2ALK2_9BURK|nr:amino acid racemase [Variovorax terrae]MCJ0762394.1 amino acid racemase [Variovorax terrae]
MQAPPRTLTVGILGGMGPAAGVDFLRHFVQACAEQVRALHLPPCDQSFPEHWLAQVPVPDRTAALQQPGAGGHQPLEPLLQALGRLAALGARSVAIACNTAHAWHGELQARFPGVELLHMAREVAQALAARGVREVGLLATEGTYRSGLYAQAMAQAGLRCHVPQRGERELLMRGIYDGVKAGDLALAQQCFAAVARDLVERHGLATLVLGCTEIPLALTQVPGVDGLALVDPAAVLAQALAQRAYGAAPA